MFSVIVMCYKQNQYSLSDPSAKSCLVPCVPCPVEPLLAVCRDQLTPDWGSADQPHKLCSKSHTADRDGVVAAGRQRETHRLGIKTFDGCICFTVNITDYRLFERFWHHVESFMRLNATMAASSLFSSCF